MSTERLDEKLSEAVYRLVEEQAFVPPLYVAAIAANGEALVIHYTLSQDLEALDGAVVAEHLPE